MNRVQSQELVHALQTGDISRREFLTRATVAFGSLAAATSLLAACAPVAGPPPPVVDATQPPTSPGLASEDGLSAGVVEYAEAGGEKLTGYLAFDEDGEQKPAVIVIQEWWGLNDHIKEVARRFAGAGFVAFAPDLYHGVATTEPNEARKLAMALDSAAAVSEIQQAMTWLRAQDGSNGKVGIVGFCMGGGLVLQTAASDPSLDAAVVFYGSPLGPGEAARVRAPILSLLGSADRIPADGYRAMHAVFDASGVPNEFQLYEGAQHAFFNDTRASSYDPVAAADAWERTLAWFRFYLSGASGSARE
ncbi:MAG: dienelactone hydrolase family protein [Caldilineales bacterium]|nr:dienelactone hydrolase family protein [Caldilineales bacterium]